jgi:2-C-methyl-D-erythritol 2,4-cyclodiphosphate synthase
VEIPFESGLVGHSDADVLTHAVIDALIGALGEGDIDTHFPDTDTAFKGISSLWMLQRVFEQTRRTGYRVQNLDATIVAEAPRLSPFASTMRHNISQALDATLEQVNIKAKTTEGMGSCGRGEGMEAFAVLSPVSGL